MEFHVKSTQSASDAANTLDVQPGNEQRNGWHTQESAITKLMMSRRNDTEKGLH